MRLHTLAVRAMAALIMLATTAAVHAQALADHVPADAIVYIGWKGGDSPGAAYAGSHLQAVLAASEFPQLFHDLGPELTDRLRQQDPRDAAAITAIASFGGEIWQRPGAFYFAGMDLSNPANPLPRVAYILDGGDQAASFAVKIDDLMRPSGPPWRCRVDGSMVVISDFATPVQIDRPLSADPEFQAAIKGTIADPVLAVYVNGQTLWPMLDAIIAQYRPDPRTNPWPRLRDQLGLTGMKHYTVVDGFEGKNWATYCNIDYPAPRRGIFADGQPLSDELLHLIPKDTVRAAGGSLDLANLYGVISQLVDQLAGDGAAQFHQAEAQINQSLGFNLQHDLLGGFGPQWVTYLDPSEAGNGGLGTLLLNRPRDPAQLSRLLLRAQDVITALAMPMRANQITIAFRAFSAGGVDIHYLALPAVAPAWAMKDGTFYAGLYPQVVEAAVTHTADSGTILDNPQLQKVRGELGNHDQMMSLMFDDLPRTVPDGYQTWMAVSRLYLGFADIFGVPTPPMVLPPLPAIMSEIEPGGMVTWSDDAGLHARAITPFPGADVLGQGGNVALASVGEELMLISILLPSLNRARETANRVKCANNLKQIGLGIALYNNENKGAYPADLGTLITAEDLSASVFCCPSTNTQLPPNLAPADAVKWANANSDYIYLGAALKAAPPPDTVIAYEKDEDHGRDGMNLLFADGHVEFMPLLAAHQQIDRSARVLRLLRL